MTDTRPDVQTPMSAEEASVEVLRSMVQAWINDRKLPTRFTYPDAEVLARSLNA